MSYPKRLQKEQGKSNSRLTEERKERLLAIQQREQLKGLIVNKFMEKYGSKNNKQNNQYIDKEVNDFIKCQKVTEENLRKLEQKIKKGVGQGSPTLSQQGGQDDDKQSNRSYKGDQFISQNPLTSENIDKLPSIQNSRASSKKGSVRGGGDNISVAGSSQAPRSVYQLGDEDDEWARIIKFDQELYKKEQEMEKLREVEQRKRIQKELNRQLDEKKYLKERDNDDLQQYNNIQVKQLQIYDEREKAKEDEKKRKIMYEKQSRDAQLAEESKRKKAERLHDKQIDQLLVQKIEEEIQIEDQMRLQRKLQEKQHLLKVMQENEVNKKILMEEQKKERDMDIKGQQEYTKLLEMQEQAREKEVKNRDEKTKKFMAMMSDTVIKDQKDYILDEEKKIQKYYQEKAAKEKQDDDEKQRKQNEDKKKMREFLDKQVQEKKHQKDIEAQLSVKQAQFWKKDSEEYQENEKMKNKYIREVNEKHADILKQQMQQNQNKSKKGKKLMQTKMNTDELLQNKHILKQMAGNGGDLQRNLVIANHKN